MGKINFWRTGALSLLAVVCVMGYAIASLRGIESAAIHGPRPINASVARSADDSTDRPYTVSLVPDWPDVQLPDAQVVSELQLAHDYTFERDWHDRHAAYWSQALERFRGRPEVSYLEVGLFEGASFFWMLEHILTDPTSDATGIDPFFREYSDVRDYGDTFDDNLDLSGQRARSTIITGFSQIELRKLPLASYDIIYIDGSHEARDVLEDAVLARRLLKDGGILIFDDYQLWWDRPAAERPQFGIDVFYTFFRDEFEVTHFGYQVMLTKKPTS